MVRDVGIPELDVGFYTGLVESLHSLAMMLLMISWGKASDKYGRKPVLIISCIGVGVGTILFGFSSKIWHMLAARCLAGAFGGSVVIIRAMFGELSTPRTAGRAFSIFAFAGNLGIFVGPFIGGLLSEPAKQYRGVFGNVKFFRDYPYALSNIVTGGFALSAALLCALFLKETLHKPEDEGNGDATSADAANKKKPLSSWELLRSPGVGPVLFMYGWNSLIGLGFTAVIPVFWFTPPKHGGYGFDELHESVFLALAGLSQALWILLVFPTWQRRRGTGSVLYVCWHLYPFLILIHPLGSILRRNGQEPAFWVVAVLAQLVTSANAMTYSTWTPFPPYRPLSVYVRRARRELTCPQLVVNWRSTTLPHRIRRWARSTRSP